MFYCQITNKLSRPGVSPHRLVVKTREKTYTKWVRNEETNKWEEVFSAKGWEIVREVNASEEGAQLWNSWTPDERETFLKANP